MSIGRSLRIAAAIAIAISGVVHLDLYFNKQYRFAGDMPNFGRSILLNAIGSAVIATAVAARTEWFVRVAGILLPLSTIAVFAYTHSSNTFLGFSATGFEPSPQAQIAMISQIAAIVLIAVTFVPAIDQTDMPLTAPAVGAVAAVAALVFIGLTLQWKPEGSTSVADGPSSTEAAAAETTPTSAADGAATTTA
ncbi:MAG: hypothetical protein ABIW84_02175, partial [Ilumatobacteraceae bacterium]